MKRYVSWLVVLVCSGLWQQAAVGQNSAASPVARALEEEIKRAMDLLTKKGDPAPYFISYEVFETKSVDIEASLGALQYSGNNESRVLDVEVRVGDYAFDNTHQLRGRAAGDQNPGSVLMPLDNDVDALKSVIWLETDRKYKTAVERLINVKANRAVRVEEEDTSGDLSRETAQQSSAPLRNAIVNMQEWERKVKAYSGMFRSFPELFDGQAVFTASVTNQYFVNNEGTSVRHGTVQFRVALIGRTRADDGMDLQRFESFDAHTVEGLPSEAVVRQTV